MKKHMSYSWKGVVFALVVITVFGSAAQAFGTAANSQDITLSATVHEPSGATGTVVFIFELEELPAASAVMNNYSSVPPEPFAVPESSTLVLVGLGVFGLMALKKRLQ